MEDDAPGDTISDEELTALALAADPDDVSIDPDAEPFGLGDRGTELLPAWYMPAPMHHGDASTRRRWVVAGIIVALLVVNGAGLCVTYGIPEVGDRIFSGF